LINILEYYLFQPIELIQSSSSLFEKSRPVDYKHNTIKIVQENVNRANTTFFEEGKQTNKEDVRNFQKEYIYRNGKNVYDKINENYVNTLQYFQDPKLNLKGQKDFYKHSGYIIRYLSSSFDIDVETLFEYAVIHNIDELNKEDKLELLNYITNDTNNSDKLYYIIKTYFEKKYLDYHSSVTIQLGDLICIQRGGLFEIANDVITLEIYEMLEESVKPYVENYPVKLTNIVVGFIDYENKSNVLLFKLRDTSKEQHRKKTGKLDKRIMNTHGFVASTSGKAKAIEILNMIITSKPSNIQLNMEKYTKENSKAFIELDICIVQELLLRYFQDVKKEDVLYFYSYEEKIVMDRIQ